MDTPLALITYIVISAVVAVVLLIAAPIFLLAYGLAIAWIWLSVLAGWMLIEALHADFENEQETKRRALYKSLSASVSSSSSAFVTLGDACRQAAADTDRFSAAWDQARRYALTGDIEDAK